MEGGGCCTGGSWRGYKWRLLHCEPHDAAVGSWLCNNCSGGAPEKLSIASSLLMFITRGSELGWRPQEGSWKMGDCVKDEKTEKRACVYQILGDLDLQMRRLVFVVNITDDNLAEEGVGKQGNFLLYEKSQICSGSAHRATGVSSTRRHAVCCVSEILISPGVLCFQGPDPTTVTRADSSDEDSVSRKIFVSSVFECGLGPHTFT